MPTKVNALTIGIEARGTYLDGGGGRSAVPLDLISNGFGAGNTITLSVSGTYPRGGGFGERDDLVAVFSSSDVLLPLGSGNRVQDAIDVGADHVTFIADIPEDFLVSDFGSTMNSVTVVIPVGAQFLFYGPDDPVYSDNFDADGDFQLSVSNVPIPAAVFLFGSALISGIGFRRRM